RFNALEVVGAPAQKTRWRRGPVPMTLDVIERRLRDVRPAVFGAVRGDTEEQQTRATTDFEHTRRAMREDALDRLFDPLPHLFCRDRLAGVAAVPTRDVEGRIDGVRLGGVCVVEYAFPLCDALGAKLPAGRLLLRAFIQHEIGHQALFARRVFTRVHDHVLHGRVLTQHGFDLARLDAQATYLDLVIRAPEEFNLPLGEIAREVARAVKTHARLLRERVRNETFGGQLGTVQVAARKLNAADEKLGRDARRDGLKAAIEQVDLRVRNRATDGYGVAVRLALASPEGHIHGRFCRAVKVVQLGLARGEETFLKLDGQRLAAAHHAAETRAVAKRWLLDEEAQHRRDEVHGR